MNDSNRLLVEFTTNGRPVRVEKNYEIRVVDNVPHLKNILKKHFRTDEAIMKAKTNRELIISECNELPITVVTSYQSQS